MPSAPEAAHAGIRDHLERVLGQPTRDWIRPDTGLSAAARYSVTLRDGSSVFVKAATDDRTESWLRTEYLALTHVPRRFVPGVLAWLDEPGDRPILVVEDLRDAHWPAGHEGVNWRDGDIDRVLAAVSDLSGLEAPPSFAPSMGSRILWPELLDTSPRRARLLELGLCTEAWLDHAAAALVAAEASLDDSGDRLVHGDLRSDNICIADDHAVFVDWSTAARGHPDHDLAILLPTLHLEDGPHPYDVMPSGCGWAAAGCASLIRRILDERESPPWLVDVFLRLAAIDLAWAASCLDLPRPDGVSPGTT